MTPAAHSLEFSMARKRPLLLPKVKDLPVSATHCGSCFRFRYKKKLKVRLKILTRKE